MTRARSRWKLVRYGCVLSRCARPSDSADFARVGRKERALVGFDLLAGLEHGVNGGRRSKNLPARGFAFLAAGAHDHHQIVYRQQQHANREHPQASQ